MFYSEKLVGVEGFEPPTLWSQTRCATKLRYTPINADESSKSELTTNGHVSGAAHDTHDLPLRQR